MPHAPTADKEDLMKHDDRSHVARVTTLRRLLLPSSARLVAIGALALPTGALGGTAAHAAGSGAGVVEANTMVVNMADGGVSATDSLVAEGPTVFIVHNLAAGRRSFLVVRSSAVPSLFTDSHAPVVPGSAVVGRAVLAPRGGLRLDVRLASGRYFLVESQTVGGAPIVADGVSTLRASLRTA
jgi:hypothetical protein